MTRRSRSAQLIRRWTALLLALACLWMSSGATLRHTDDLSDFLVFTPGQIVLRHSAPPPPAVPCVAHEWMNAWQTLHTARVSVVFSPVLLAIIQETLTAVLHLSGFDYVSLRAPPPALA